MSLTYAHINRLIGIRQIQSYSSRIDIELAMSMYFLARRQYYIYIIYFTPSLQSGM